MGVVNFLEMVAGTRVDLKGLEEGFDKGEALAEDFGKGVARSIEEAPSKAVEALKEHFKGLSPTVLGVMGLIATAIGAVVYEISRAITETAAWGEEMEHLGARMGVTAQQASNINGLLERYGVGTMEAHRATMQLSMQIRATQEALDPFSTRLGKVLGTLKDSAGANLNFAQVLDLVREKVNSAGSAQEKANAMQLMGIRNQGALIGALDQTKDSWDSTTKAVEKATGSVNAAVEEGDNWKEATAALSQEFRGLQNALGTTLLPVLTSIIESMTWLISLFKEYPQVASAILPIVTVFKSIAFVFTELAAEGKQATAAVLKLMEILHLVPQGTTEAYLGMEKIKEEAEKAAHATKELAEQTEATSEAIQITEQKEQQLVNLQKERLQTAEKLRSLGMASDDDVKKQVEGELTRLDHQRQLLQAEFDKVNTGRKSDDPQVLAAQAKLDTNKLATADLLAKQVQEGYSREEMHQKALGKWQADNEIAHLKLQLADEKIIGDERERLQAQLIEKETTQKYAKEELNAKAIGAFGLEAEMNLLQAKLRDAHYEGDERLKLEAELFSARKKYTEEVLKIGQAMGFSNVDAEISYRKSHAADLLGKGDAIGAAGELMKAKDLAIKQADSVQQFLKKIGVINLQEELDFQHQKLQAVKGNADQERAILGHMADLDQQLYEKRLGFALNYYAGTLKGYRELMALTHQKDESTKASESQTFAQADNEKERIRFQNAKAITEVAHQGGDEATRQKSIDNSNAIMKNVDELTKAGEKLTAGMIAEKEAAMALLSAASGGRKIRDPGAPSPVIGQEGFSTAGLSRGADISGLDTSFQDMSVRVRDVLLGAIPNVQNFSNAVADAVKKIGANTGFLPNAGAVGPTGGVTQVSTQGSGQPSTGTSSPAVNTLPTPTPQAGIQQASGGGGSSAALADKLQKLIDAITKQTDAVTAGIQNAQDSNKQDLADALQAVLDNIPDTHVIVTVDPNSGDLLAQALVTKIS